MITRYLLGVSAALISSLCILLPMSAKAEEKINFVLWNNGPGQSFDSKLWNGIIAKNYRDAVSLFASAERGPDRIREVVKGADGPEPETVVALSVVELNLDVSAFPAAMRNFDAKMPKNAQFEGAMTLVDEPLCRAMQTVMKPQDYTPYTVLFIGAGPKARERCYKAIIDMLYERDGSGTAVDETALQSQNAMPEIYSMGWKIIDLSDSEKSKRRERLVFKPGEKILFQTTLDYVRKEGAGAPGAMFSLRLDLEVKDKITGAVSRTENIKTYEGIVSHRVPVDANYFRNWLQAGINLPEVGEYELSYIFTDLNAPAAKQKPVRVKVEVEIE